MNGRRGTDQVRGSVSLGSASAESPGPVTLWLIGLLAFALAGSLALLAFPTVAVAAPSVDPHASLMSSPFGCPACHTSSGVIYASVSDADPALGSVSDEGCIRCHVLPGGSGAKVYAGAVAHYRVADGFGHNDPLKVTCLSCHSIHTPDVTSAALSGALLRKLDYQRKALRAVDLATASPALALSVWCTGCHPQWPDSSAKSTKAAAASGDAFAAQSVAHPFGPARAGSTWRASTSCFSCHAAPGGFPHYTPGADAGLVGASSASDTRVAIDDRRSDGVCLGCHRSGTAGSEQGIGVTY